MYFKMVRNNEIVCQSDGRWSRPEPICEQTDIQCDQVPMVSYATVSDYGEYNVTTRKSKVGVVIRYHCNAGAQLVDNSRNYVVCLQNGTWSMPLPQCTLITDWLRQNSNCDPVPSVQNAQVTQLLGWTPPYRIQYSCNRGYALSPNTSNVYVECNNQLWSLALPICVRSDCGRGLFFLYFYFYNSF